VGLRDFTLSDVIERNARLHGERLAFVADGQRLSHREYAQRVERLAAGLAGLGLAAGERVAVLAQNCLAYVELYGAAARLGLILVPVNWRLSAEEIAYVIADTTPKAIVAGGEYLAVIEAARDRFPTVEHCFSLGAATGAFRAFEDLARAGEGRVAPEADFPSGSGYVIIHTAAVGGRPRGALLSHAGLLAANLQLAGCWDLSTRDVHLGVLPLFHASGLGLTLAVQQAGGATVVLPRFDPAAVAQAIASEKVTVFAEFPPMLGTLLDKAARDGDDLSSLRHLTGLDTPETIARFETVCPSARFWAGYGQSEVSGLVTIAPFRERPGSAGVPTALNRVQVVDDLDRVLPAGQTGEIVVRGPMVFNGYWNCDTDNEFTFRNGWHHTGDVGRFDEDGFLTLMDRRKDLVISGGFNVYPSDLEAVLRKHPGVADAAVVGVPSAEWGETPVAFVVPRAGAPAPDELRAWANNQLGKTQRLADLRYLPELPRSEIGKVLKRELRNAYTQQ